MHDGVFGGAWSSNGHKTRGESYRLINFKQNSQSIRGKLARLSELLNHLENLKLKSANFQQYNCAARESLLGGHILLITMPRRRGSQTSSTAPWIIIFPHTARQHTLLSGELDKNKSRIVSRTVSQVGTSFWVGRKGELIFTYGLKTLLMFNMILISYISQNESRGEKKKPSK